ncbi:hypothetical protein [Tardisphaera saccharovorans]
MGSARLSDLLVILLFGALALPVISWFNCGHGLIYMTDSNFPLFPREDLTSLLHAWAWYGYGGYFTYANCMLPYYALVFVLNSLAGFSVAEMSIWYLTFAASGLSMYLFPTEFLPRGRAGTVGAAISGISYTYSTYWLFET